MPAARSIVVSFYSVTFCKINQLLIVLFKGSCTLSQKKTNIAFAH